MPKYFLGGLFSAGSGLMSAGAQGLAKRKMMGAAMQGGMQGAASGQTSADKVGGAVEGVVGSFGPIGAAVSGVSQMAGKAFGMKEDGYKNTTSEFLDSSLNMKKGVRNLMDNSSALFRGRLTKDAALDQFSLGLLGKSTAEKKAEEEAAWKKWNRGVMATNENQLASNMARIPVATAPLYGKRGLKLVMKTKF